MYLNTYLVFVYIFLNNLIDEIEAAKLWSSRSGLSSNLEEIKKNWAITYEMRKSEIRGLNNIS